MLAPIIDDAHYMPIECLRKLRLLLEDFPKNHNLILIAPIPACATNYSLASMQTSTAASPGPENSNHSRPKTCRPSSIPNSKPSACPRPYSLIRPST